MEIIQAQGMAVCAVVAQTWSAACVAVLSAVAAAPCVELLQPVTTRAQRRRRRPLSSRHARTSHTALHRQCLDQRCGSIAQAAGIAAGWRGAMRQARCVCVCACVLGGGRRRTVRVVGPDR
jgi:hypothetical protein